MSEEFAGAAMRQFEAIVRAVLLVFAAGVCFGQVQGRCYAFILRADVFVTCGGTTTQVTHRADLEGFAVSDEQASFVYTTSRVLKRTATTAFGYRTTTVIDLRTGGRKDVEHVGGGGSTCGGIFTLGAPGYEPAGLDVLHGDWLSYPPYSRFRCSSDRKVVVGTEKEGIGGDLYLGFPPKMKVAGAGEDKYFNFNISPDGSKIAYFSDPYLPLCVFSAPGPARCAEDRAASADLPSVDNAGEVLVTASTDDGCHYRTPWYFSRTPLPGRTSGDACAAIGYWKPGMKSIEIIESLGRNPQWISPATAKLLRDWSARSGGDAPK